MTKHNLASAIATTRWRPPGHQCGGRDPFAPHGYVNPPPVYHASQLLYESDVAEDYSPPRQYQYAARHT